MKFIKKLNWANIATIAVVSLITITLIYPLIRPGLQKLPVIGKKFV